MTFTFDTKAAAQTAGLLMLIPLILLTRHPPSQQSRLRLADGKL